MENEITYRTQRHPYSAPGLKDINDIVSEVFGIERSDLFLRTRKREIVDARAVAMWWIRRHKQFSLQKIGGKYHLDYATARHHILKVEGLIEFDRDMQTRVAKVVAQAAPIAGNPLDKNITMNERDLKRMLFAAFHYGEKSFNPYFFSWNELPGIGRYRRIRSFLEHYQKREFEAIINQA